MAERINQRISEMDQLIQCWPGSAIHPVQTTAGPLDLKMDGAVGDELSVIRLSLAPKVIDSVVIDAHRTDMILVEQPQICMGVKITPPALLVNHSGREYRSVLEPGFRSVEFMLDNRAIEIHSLGQRLADARSRQEQTVIPLTQNQASALRKAADAYIAASETSVLETSAADSLQPCVSQQMQENVLRALSAAFEGPRGTGAQKCTVPVRGSIALAALREMERIGLHEVQIGDLCTQLGVSRRAVEKSFEGTLGISPAQYVLACRLNNLRSSLLGSAKRVSDSLAECGFSDASRAARQYRRLFGELPSVTLNRAQARISSSGN